jgi:hypothetical protein
VFSVDATFDLGTGELMHGGATYAEAVKGHARGRHLAAPLPDARDHLRVRHRGHGHLDAQRLCRVAARPVTGERVGFKGYAREYETYRKIDGVWKITTWRLRYDRFRPATATALAEICRGRRADASATTRTCPRW